MLDARIVASVSGSSSVARSDSYDSVHTDTFEAPSFQRSDGAKKQTCMEAGFQENNARKEMKNNKIRIAKQKNGSIFHTY